MARRLERFPGVRVTFNFVPSLVDQIEAAAAGERIGCSISSAVRSSRSRSRSARIVARRCVQVPPHAVARWSELRDLRDAVTRSAEPPGGDVLLALETWFLLAWLDPMFLAEPEAAAGAHGERSRLDRHRDALVALHQRLLGEILPAYRALARSRPDRAERLALLPSDPAACWSTCAACSAPARPRRAARARSPRRRTRAARSSALVRHAQVFGARARGSVAVGGQREPRGRGAGRGAGRALARHRPGACSSARSIRAFAGSAYRPWRLTTAAGDITLLFRDHELSDRIGFVYQRWSRPGRRGGLHRSESAASGASTGGDDPALVCGDARRRELLGRLPGGRRPFLDGLYEALPQRRRRAHHHAQRSDRAAPAHVRAPAPPFRLVDRRRLPHLGRVIREKNRAWELLARRASDAGRALARGASRGLGGA